MGNILRLLPPAGGKGYFPSAAVFCHSSQSVCDGSFSVNSLFVLAFLGAEEDRKVHPGAERQDLRTARPPPHRPHREGPASGILAAGEGLTVNKVICVRLCQIPPGRRSSGSQLRLRLLLDFTLESNQQSRR